MFVASVAPQKVCLVREELFLGLPEFGVMRIKSC